MPLGYVSGCASGTVCRVMRVRSDDDPAAAAPAIVLVWSGSGPSALVLPPTAELGRRISIEGATHDVSDDRMSRDHAVVRWERGSWVVRDLDSRNGTYLNGERAVGELRRRGDAVLRLGHSVFLLLGDGRGHGGRSSDGDIVGPELARAYAALAPDAPAVYLQGEAGTGKQRAARRWHDTGPRAAGPCINVNCGSIPEGVAERLLFGGTRGAIETIGHYQMARGGTLLLADLGALDAKSQRRLAELLAEPGVDAPGIVGTGQALEALVADGQLDPGLAQRFAPTAVTLPPLRARKVDIARLVEREVAAAAAGHEPPQRISPHAKLVEACCIRAWPGNVRELCSTVRCATLEALAGGREVVRPEHLAPSAGVSHTVAGQTAVERKNPLGRPDREILIAAIARANGDLSIAARGLNLHRDRLKTLLVEYGLVADEA